YMELVGPRDLTNAIGLNSSAFNVARMIGPALAGVLISTAGMAAPFYGTALTCLAALAGISMIRRPSPPRRGIAGSVWQSIREGFRWVRGNRAASSIVLLVSFIAVLLMPYSMLLPVFA